MKGTHLRDSYATWALVAINIIVFAAISIFPELAEVLLLNPGMLRERPLSLLTVFFSHEALVHILLNMLLLVVFGTRLERETNAQAVAGVYFACGLIGSVTILAYASAIGYQGGAIAGASASAFGIAAAYAGLNPNAVVMKSKAVHWVVALFVVNALLAIQNPQLSVGGPSHATGIVAGLALGYALRRKAGR
ncbi:MAG TPA: rhomboid family intramembrane serine protease [Firmicutes bacterium]|jgi:membrane associated rhomboid family serine protease|nr:rhomboid family intramembrane serine protease [Bacillota bacterium]